MKHRNSHLLIGYWTQLRNGRDVPDQADIEPRAIKRILSHVFILEASETERPLYRLAGTSHCDRYGTELKGTNFLERWEPESRVTAAALLKQAIAFRCPVCLSSLAINEDGAFAQIETVLAPVTFGGSTPTRFIGISQAVGDHGALFGKPIVFERLVSSQRVRDTGIVDPPDSSAPPPASRCFPKAPHLKLVINREKPAIAPCEMDAAMRRLIEALEIVPQGKLRAVS
ncbi:MAG: PAS domain-containing protein [Alphaproteobacteria bacterium]|nr:PAS domain-containing protein [Alphaproteobacteria bacterium]